MVVTGMETAKSRSSMEMGSAFDFTAKTIEAAHTDDMGPRG